MGQSTTPDQTASTPEIQAGAKPPLAPPSRRIQRAPETTVRKLAEFFVLGSIALLLIRTFLAEGYVIPSGSMAPTLIGIHRDIHCTRCETVFSHGLEGEISDLGKPVCPNCGNPELDDELLAKSDGDRVLVQKHFYCFRAPRRWEVAVFSPRTGLGQPFIKRVVGLPGEEVRIRSGDLYINGKLARKELQDQQAMRVLVYDHDHLARDHAFNPRWVTHPVQGPEQVSSAWQPVPGGFMSRSGVRAGGEIDWLSYRHWQPDRECTGPVRDFLAYNGAGLGGDYRVDDLMLECDVALNQRDQSLHFAFGKAQDRLEVSLSSGLDSMPEVRMNGAVVPVRPGSGKLTVSPSDSPIFSNVVASYFDHRLWIVIDGRLAFDPIDFEAEDSGPPASTPLLAVGAGGSGSTTLKHLRVYRDIYYTPQLSGAYQAGFGVAEPYRLGPDEFFLLGDNSEISLDSRFWPTGPVVRRGEFIGKPIVVHFPGRMMPLFWRGGAPFWVPDFREIRYIR